MNVRPSVERLPDSVRKLIATDKTVASRIAGGMELPDVLASPAWAAEWAERAELPLKRIFGGILLRYGAVPFEEEKGEAESLRDGGYTGAERRVALARLRRSGILFAVRKTWGDRLYYVPTDMVPVWQRLILPANAAPLDAADAAEVRVTPAPFRLPLALELLSAWASVRRTGIPLTAKGAMSKSAAAKLASAMRLTAEELAPLGLVYPAHEQQPATAALAVDLGLCVGALRKRGSEIVADESGMTPWLEKTPAEAEAEIHRLVLERYVSADPERHLSASAVAACREGFWHKERDIAGIGVDPAAAEAWLRMLIAFGWAERGTFRGEGVFRLLVSLEEDPDKTGYGDAEPFLVQPDGEIYVPPGVGLGARWQLEEISERVSADRMFVYRLTKSASERAFAAGWRQEDVVRFLESGGDAPLPEPVSGALSDWFGRLGKTRMTEETLLRTDSAETACRLLEDPETASCLIERLGDRDFIVDRAKVPALEARLAKIGSPAISPKPKSVPQESPAAGRDGLNEAGWIPCSRVLSFYEPDRTVASADELFPGVGEVPSAWLRKPGLYHASTRQEIIRRAIGWRAALQIGDETGQAVFVPHALHERGDGWEVSGRWRPAGEAAGFAADPSGPVTLPADRLGALRIVLPEWEPAASK
ncbi:hypothetical protein GE107_01235 [Cohnella sp. CFH 77786]|uniref:helicase-associated domain-containing protein n=1 Tax=Cohnella sp. CFH 77786 TaxID=2662265 RepID=UPI001C60EE7D|nr:helicase-associated domain-containing protein [Cohnella sp. CFH 77786]MBW5444690.1 hypothetical protein [Cohnella sp. CFH 77786]